MVQTSGKILQNREQAARLLAIKVANYKDSDAIVVGVGHEGASVGATVAKELNLGFEIVLCRKVMHPAYPEKVIGSISDGTVVMNEDTKDIPQNFIANQVTKLRLEIEKDYKFVYGNSTRPSFKYKTVILVGDVQAAPSYLLAGLKVVQSQNPLRVIVAVSVIEPHVASEFVPEVNDLVFVHMGGGQLNETHFYEHYPPVDLTEIKKSVTSINSNKFNKTAEHSWLYQIS